MRRRLLLPHVAKKHEGMLSRNSWYLSPIGCGPLHDSFCTHPLAFIFSCYREEFQDLWFFVSEYTILILRSRTPVTPEKYVGSWVELSQVKWELLTCKSICIEDSRESKSLREKITLYHLDERLCIDSISCRKTLTSRDGSDEFSIRISPNPTTISSREYTHMSDNIILCARRSESLEYDRESCYLARKWILLKVWSIAKCHIKCGLQAPDATKLLDVFCSSEEEIIPLYSYSSRKYLSIKFEYRLESSSMRESRSSLYCRYNIWREKEECYEK